MLYLCKQQVLKFWKAHNLPVPPLEQYITANLSALAETLTLLLEACPEDGLPWVLDFSPILYLKAVQSSLSHMVQESEKVTPVSEVCGCDGVCAVITYAFVGEIMGQHQRELREGC